MGVFVPFLEHRLDAWHFRSPHDVDDWNKMRKNCLDEFRREQMNMGTTPPKANEITDSTRKMD